MAAMAQEKGRSKRKRVDARVCRPNGPVERSLPVPAEEPLRAAHMCNRSASCRSAICGTATCDGIGLLAYARKQPPPRVRVAVVPMTGPCLDSNGFGRQAYA